MKPNRYYLTVDYIGNQKVIRLLSSDIKIVRTFHNWDEAYDWVKEIQFRFGKDAFEFLLTEI